MRFMPIMFLLTAVSAWGQTTGSATTTGICSPASTGNNNTFAIHCGIGKTQGDEILKIVNLILEKQLDLKAVTDKLGEIEKSIPKSRVMSPDKFEAFTAALAVAPGALGIVLASSSEDAFPLAQQLTKGAEQSRWGPVVRPTARDSEMGITRDVIGLECYSQHWSTPDGVAFKKAMAAGGLSCTYFPTFFHDDGVIINPSGITIVIGRHPG